LSIATNEYIGKDKQTNEPRYHTEWHYATFYKEKAEAVANYVKAGSKIMVVGPSRKSTGNDGKVYLEIRVEEFEFLDSKPKTLSTAPSIPPSAIADEEQEWEAAAGRHYLVRGEAPCRKRHRKLSPFIPIMVNHREATNVFPRGSPTFSASIHRKKDTN